MNTNYKVPELPLEAAEVCSDAIYGGHSGRVEATEYMVDGTKLFTEQQMIDFAEAFLKLNQVGQ